MTEELPDNASTPLRDLRLGLAVVLLGLFLAGFFVAPGPWQSALLLGCMALALALAAWPQSALTRVTIVLLAAAGVRVGFPHAEEYAGLATPMLLLRQTVIFAFVPLVQHVIVLALGPRRPGFRVDASWLYFPLVLGTLASAVFMGAQSHFGVPLTGLATGQAFIPLGIAYLLTTALILQRFATAEPPPPPPSPAPVPKKAAALEESARLAAAGRAYAREGQLDKSAEMLRRAGDWSGAAEAFKRMGSYFEAGEMYYRAGLTEEALAMYERANAHSAAALLCQQAGWPERAAQCFERAGDAPAAVAALEEAGLAPPAELLLGAGLYERAAAAFEAGGHPEQAAEVRAQHLGDREGAARLYLEAGRFEEAGGLFESLGRRDEAIDAYARLPATALRAAQLCLDAGDATRAREITARLAPEARVRAMDDEAGALVLARADFAAGKTDEAIRALQQLKRAGDASGSAYLLLGRCFAARGLPDLAEGELREALTRPLTPDEELEARYSLAGLLESRSQAAEARDLYRDILQRDFAYRDAEARYKALQSGAQ
jgi:tetratricopeptide (TPR) repeat protein